MNSWTPHPGPQGGGGIISSRHTSSHLFPVAGRIIAVCRFPNAAPSLIAEALAIGQRGSHTVPENQSNQIERNITKQSTYFLLQLFVLVCSLKKLHGHDRRGNVQINAGGRTPKIYIFHLHIVTLLVQKVCFEHSGVGEVRR